MGKVEIYLIWERKPKTPVYNVLFSRLCSKDIDGAAILALPDDPAVTGATCGDPCGSRGGIALNIFQKDIIPDRSAPQGSRHPRSLGRTAYGPLLNNEHPVLNAHLGRDPAKSFDLFVQIVCSFRNPGAIRGILLVLRGLFEGLFLRFIFGIDLFPLKRRQKLYDQIHVQGKQLRVLQSAAVKKAVDQSNDMEAAKKKEAEEREN